MMQPPGSPTRVKLEFAQESDPGRDPNKQVNEDSCGYAETRLGHLAVLCDGMGGHYGGKEASRTAIATIFEVIERTPPGTPPSAALKAAIEEAGRRVYLLGGPPENRTRPGSTVVAMVLHDGGVDIAHVGDSRAFVIRSNQIYPLTRDHSMVQGMIDAGMLTEQQAMGHPDANKITRALGMKPEVEVEVRPEPMELYVGDVLIMASDGLTDLALNADILGCSRQALASGSVEHACRMLVQFANDRGGHDNITVQMARVIETGTRTLTIPEAPRGQADAGPRAQPQETIVMTQTEEAEAAPAPLSVGPVQPVQPAPTAPWGPIPATSPGAAGPTSPGAEPPPTPRPTAIDPATAPQPTQPGTPIAPPVAPHAPPPSLGAYRVDGSPGALPLPPPGSPQYVGAVTDQYPGPTPGPTSPYASTPMPATAPHSFATGAPATLSGARPPRGGIVFIIIGFSAVIAVLLVLLLWALLPE